jgi:cytochrome c553
MKVLFRAMACLTLLASASLMAEGDAARGEEKAGMCAACHGLDGNSTMAMWPKLAGQHPADLERQIKLIKTGARPVPEMAGIVAALSDQDIADLSAYFAGQVSGPAVADPELVSEGERLYRAGNPTTRIPACMSCHGPAGEGNPLAGYPALAGQHSVYLAKMLEGFKSGTNWGEDDAGSNVMVGVSALISASEIQAVSSYIQGLYSKDSE